MNKIRIDVNRQACESEEQYQSLCDLMNDVEEGIKEDRTLWIKEMRRLGAKAGIENDGWVDMAKREFHIAGKPIFNDGFDVGSIIAFRHILSVEYFLAEITGKINGWLIPADWIYWQYRPITLTRSIKENP